jgi:hypothetical protein
MSENKVTKVDLEGVYDDGWVDVSTRTVEGVEESAPSVDNEKVVDDDDDDHAADVMDVEVSFPEEREGVEYGDGTPLVTGGVVQQLLTVDESAPSVDNEKVVDDDDDDHAADVMDVEVSFPEEREGVEYGDGTPLLTGGVVQQLLTVEESAPSVDNEKVVDRDDCHVVNVDPTHLDLAVVEEKIITIRERKCDGNEESSGIRELVEISFGSVDLLDEFERDAEVSYCPEHHLFCCDMIVILTHHASFYLQTVQMSLSPEDPRLGVQVRHILCCIFLASI